MKEFINKLKELWKIPLYNGLLKLGLYILFFGIAFGILGIMKLATSSTEPVVNKTYTENYLEMESYEYNYQINYETKKEKFEQVINGTKYKDTNEFKYDNVNYYFKEDDIYNKTTNELVNNLTIYNLKDLFPNIIIEWINLENKEEKITTYKNGDIKTEYKIIYDLYNVYITVYVKDNYIYKIEFDMSEYINKTNKEILEYKININYTNINNISSYD